jgi:hypothetical protein
MGRRSIVEVDARIDEGMRNLVRAGTLTGWRRYRYHQEWWTICPARPGKCQDLSRSEAVEYLRQRGSYEA